MKMKERDWILLSLFLNDEANKEQIEMVVKWRHSSFENYAIFQDVDKIKKCKPPVPVFDSKKAFRKLDKKIHHQ